MKLIFEDDFNGTELDASKWARCPQWERHQGSFWKDEMSYLDGKSNLILLTDRCAESENHVNTGAVRSKGLFEHAFGYYEASIKFTPFEGIWGAFWLMGESVFNVDGSGRDGTEIDIIEFIRNEKELCNSALHWDGYGSAHKSEAKEYAGTGIYDGNYHIFGLNWTPDDYAFYIDGREMWKCSYGGVCQNPLYIKLTVESAPWMGKVDKTKLPAYMYVDYVKVYEN